MLGAHGMCYKRHSHLQPRESVLGVLPCCCQGWAALPHAFHVYDIRNLNCVRPHVSALPGVCAEAAQPRTRMSISTLPCQRCRRTSAAWLPRPRALPACLPGSQVRP